MKEELDEGLALLKDLGQPGPFTFAYPCGETWIGDPAESYIPLIEERFVAARGVAPRAAGLAPDLFDVPAFFLKTNGADLISILDQAPTGGTWIVFGFHGIGGDWESLSMQAHEELLQYLDVHRARFHVAPFGEIASCLKGD